MTNDSTASVYQSWVRQHLIIKVARTCCRSRPFKDANHFMIFHFALPTLKKGSIDLFKIPEIKKCYPYYYFKQTNKKTNMFFICLDVQ